LAKKRTIPKSPEGHKNYFIIDANVLVYLALPQMNRSKYIKFTDHKEQLRAERCLEYWKIINKQLKKIQARIYVPDVCIAEAFKVLAKRYYKKKYFQNSGSYYQATERLRKLISTPHKEMSKAGRQVKIHDVGTNRDIIISVDRFFERMYRGGKEVQTSDLILLAAAKYLMDFYDISRDHLYILTCDNKLVNLISCIQELPNAINPTEDRYRADKTFI
jgi:hypothetical protein